MIMNICYKMKVNKIEFKKNIIDKIKTYLLLKLQFKQKVKVLKL